MTAKQRAKIYRKAAEIMHQPSTQFGCCWAILKVAGHDKLLDVMEGEIRLLKPRLNEYGAYWYPLGEQNREPRILALLLSAEIALNP